MKAPERFSWIDIARGIGIVLVMYAHVFSSSSNKYLIYGFHLPLFFFLSGLVFTSTNKPFLQVVKKVARQVLIPYLLYGLSTFLFWYFLLNQNAITLAFVFEQIKKFLLARVVDQYVFFNVPLWFLPCLFTTKVLFAGFLKIVHKPLFLSIVLFVSSVIGWLLSRYFQHEKLILVFEVALSAVVFFGVGYLFKHVKPMFKLSSIQKVFSLGVVSILYFLLTTFHFNLTGSHVDMRINEIHNYFLFYVHAFLGISAVVLLSQLLKQNSVLEYLGKNSLVLFVWHYPLFMYFTFILPSFLPTQTVESLKVFNPIDYTLAAMVIILGGKEIHLKFVKPVILNLIQDLYRFPIKSGMTK